MLKKKYNNRPSLSQSPATQLSYHHSIDQTPNKINTVISKIFLQEKYFPNLKICSFWLSKQYHADKYEVSDTLNGGGVLQFTPSNQKVFKGKDLYLWHLAFGVVMLNKSVDE